MVIMIMVKTDLGRQNRAGHSFGHVVKTNHAHSSCLSSRHKGAYGQEYHHALINTNLDGTQVALIPFGDYPAPEEKVEIHTF